MVLQLPEPLESRPFSVARAAGLGVPVSKLRRRSLDAPFPGVRVPRSLEPTFELRCPTYSERMAPGQFFSHLTAARLWGLWVPGMPSADELLHVTATLPGRAPRVPGVVGHHVEPDLAASTVIRGLPVATPAETLRGLSSLLSLDALVEACDSLVRRKHPLLTMRELQEVTAGHGGRRGIRVLREALLLTRSGADSPRETRVRLLLVRAGLPEPKVNAVISRPGARVTRFGDLVYEEWRVVVEYEGIQHSDDRGTYTGDIARFEELDEWRFVRVTKEHFAAPVDIVRRVTAALRARGWRG